MRGCTVLETVLEDTSVKATMGVFRIKFPQSVLNTGEKRGQQPFTAAKAKDVREALLECANVVSDFGGTDNVATRMVQGVSIFGVAPSCAERAPERQLLGHLRYQCSGSREVLMCSTSVLGDVASKLGIAYNGQGFFEYMGELMDLTMTSEGIKTVEAFGGTIHHHKVVPGDLMFIPIGTVVWERALGDQYNIGFRTSHLTGNASSITAFKSAVEQHRAAVNNPASPMVKFWDAAIGELDKKGPAGASAA